MYLPILSLQSATADKRSLFSADFVPDLITPQTKDTTDDTKKKAAVYSKYPSLLEKANRFLQENPTLAVRSCETIPIRMAYKENPKEKDVWDNYADPELTWYKQTGEAVALCLKGLRLWFTRCPNKVRMTHPPADLIGYRDFVPKFSPEGFPTPATQAELWEEANLFLTYNPLAGRIISVETLLNCPQSRKQFDPDMTTLAEILGESNQDYPADHVQLKQPFIWTIRLWYVMGEPQRERIRFADFYPTRLNCSDVVTRDNLPRFELLPDVLQKVEKWVNQLPSNVSLLNINTLSMRTTESGEICSPHVTFLQDDCYHRYYMKFLRVIFVERDQEVAGPPAYGSRRLSSMRFMPLQLEKGGFLSVTKYESTTTTKTHLDQWVQQNAKTFKIVGAETVVYKAKSGGEERDGFDAMFTWNSDSWSKNYRKFTPDIQIKHLIGLQLFLEAA